MGAKLIAWARDRFLPQSSQCSLGPTVKIASWNGRMDACLVPEIPLNIPAILAQQRVALVLGMALKEYEQALSLFHERVYARVRGVREHAVSAGLQIFSIYAVPAGVRNIEPRRGASQQRMLGHPRALEDAEILFTAPAPSNAIHVQDRGMCGQAGPHRGVCVLVRPIKDPGHHPPARLVSQIGRNRILPGHDETIEAVQTGIPKRFDA